MLFTSVLCATQHKDRIGKKTFLTPILDLIKILVPYCVLFYYFVESNIKLKLIDKVYRRREVVFKISFVFGI